MKYILQAFIALLLLQSCQSDELKISFKTIDIDVQGTLGSSLKHRSKYYCYFEKDNPFAANRIIDFYILDENGKTEAHIPPPPVFFSDYGLSLRNDTIFTTHYDYDGNRVFYLDEKKKKWLETQKVPEIIFKDKNYTISSNTPDRFCYSIRFKDHKTGQQYGIYTENPMINQVNNAYYLTSTNYILKIPDPRKMEIAGQSNSERYCSSQHIDSIKGAELQYKNSTSSMFKSSIATSFVVKNQLYHLYSEDGSTKITVLKNNELVPVFELKDDIFPYREHYDKMNFAPGNNYQTLRFSTNDPYTSGMIEIDRNKFNIITFRNKYREPILGEPYTKAWVEKNFMDFYTHFNTLSINQIDRIEQKENILNLSQYKTCGDTFLESCDDRVYKKIERKYVHLLTSYHYDPQNKLVNFIEFEWVLQSRATVHEEDDIRVLESLNSNKIFHSKFDWLYSFLKQKLGDPVTGGADSSYAKWKIGKQTIELSCREYRGTYLKLYNDQE